MNPVLSELIFLAACLVGLLVGYALLVRLLRTVAQFINDLFNTAVALLFFLVIVPPLWVWYRCRRPPWRTLTQQQTQELRAWIKTTASR